MTYPIQIHPFYLKWFSCSLWTGIPMGFNGWLRKQRWQHRWASDTENCSSPPMTEDLPKQGSTLSNPYRRVSRKKKKKKHNPFRRRILENAFEKTISSRALWNLLCSSAHSHFSPSTERGVEWTGQKVRSWTSKCIAIMVLIHCNPILLPVLGWRGGYTFSGFFFFFFKEPKKLSIHCRLCTLQYFLRLHQWAQPYSSSSCTSMIRHPFQSVKGSVTSLNLYTGCPCPLEPPPHFLLNSKQARVKTKTKHILSTRSPWACKGQ